MVPMSSHVFKPIAVYQCRNVVTKIMTVMIGKMKLDVVSKVDLEVIITKNLLCTADNQTQASKYIYKRLACVHLY